MLNNNYPALSDSSHTPICQKAGHPHPDPVWKSARLHAAWSPRRTIQPEAPSKIPPFLPFLITLLLILATTSVAIAQLYDNVQRPSLGWHELNTTHFRIIFHDGYRQTALRAARLLEEEYAEIQQLVGGELHRFPVIINGYNDRSNGYVTSFNFRMEVEAPPIAGKILNPRTGGHLENLMAHELVHALQFSEKGPKLGVSSFFYLFWPDGGRSMHGLMASGMIEGFAVYQESNLNANVSGRGNYAPFTQRFNANFNSNQRWSMGQLVTPPGATSPGDRFYIGGYHFTDWLADTHGKETLRRSIRNFARFPLLGYAPILGLTTSTMPGQLYRDFVAEVESREVARLDSVRRAGITPAEPVDFGRLRGSDVHRPVFVNNDEILFFSRFYNARPGLRIYNLRTGDIRLLHEVSLDESAGFSVSPDGNAVVYARYSPHPFHDNRSHVDLHQFDFTTGQTTRITQNERLRKPAHAREGRIYALQNHRETNQWVTVYPDSITRVISIYPDNIVEIAPNPSQLLLSAVIANRNGVQGLWFTHETFEKDILPQEPDIYFLDGSIHDPVWSPDGLRLMFTGERNGIMNIYEYDYAEDILRQLTSSLFNDMEPAYHPAYSGTSEADLIAFVVNEGEQRRLATLRRKDFLNLIVPDSEWRIPTYALIRAPRMGDTMRDEQVNWTESTYRTGFAWLKPRLILPTFSVVNNVEDFAVGLELSSADVLRRHAYTAGFQLGQYQNFYTLRYRYTGFYPALEVEATQSAYNPGNLAPNNYFFGEERRYSVSSPNIYQFDTRKGLSYVFVRPEVAYLSSRIRFGNVAQNSTDWNTSTRLRQFVYGGWQVRQNIRAAQPVSGVNLLLQADYDVDNSANVRPFRAYRAGIYAYAAPLALWNQSLRIGAEVIRQNRLGYNTLGIIHEGFDRDDFILPAKDYVVASARYTIPIMHPDDGGFLLPFYAERVYAVIFGETVADTRFGARQSIAGAGLRVRIRIINLPLDLGIGVALPLDGGKETIVVNF